MTTAVSAVSAPPRVRRIALAGNPNAGKTTLFNALTGLRQKVGNYPGVTVEKKEGRCKLPDGEVTILDLPGTYSLTPKSPDEEIARDVLLGLREDTPVPDAVLIVVDASNLERNLYLATQILELGLPSVIALNMTDVAAAAGKAVDAHHLSHSLGCPVVELVAVRGEGIDRLKNVLSGELPVPNPPALKLPEKMELARTELSRALAPDDIEADNPEIAAGTRGIALRLLCGNAPLPDIERVFGERVARVLESTRKENAVRPAFESGPRYVAIGGVVKYALSHSDRELSQSFTDKADAVLTHKVWGLVTFALITLLVFQSIYSFAGWPMDFLSNTVTAFGEWVAKVMPDGPVEDLLVNGAIAGVGAVVVFIPQILILFFFIGLLEDSGYMARAAFIMDKLMGRVGLHGRAFIPLLSSFACAIPGIMAARTIASRRDRMTTILIAPLMSCSARLPVYYLMIGTFIPDHPLFGVTLPVGPKGFFLGLTTRAATMFGLYILGVAAAMLAAWVFKRTLFKGPQPALMLELPPYKVPAWRNVVTTMWDRGAQFMQRAGTVIFALSILLWFALSYPKVDPKTLAPGLSADRIASIETENSAAGRLGHAIEPLIAPLGFNWKMGIGLIGSMAAREVFVSTMGTVYSVGQDADEESKPLREAMKEDKWPDGRPVWTPLTAVSLLVYFVLAMQCISTLAVVKRETNSWSWPAFMLVYMTGGAWLASFLVYQGGRLLGWG